MKKVLIGVGLAIACASVVAKKSLDHRDSSLPVNLYKTSESKGDVTIRLAKQPSNNFVLGLTVEDADIPDEGYLMVNGRKVSSLFGGRAQSGNDLKVTKLKVITPPDIWQAGNNRVEFVRTRTNGFQILALNTWEMANSSTEPSSSDRSVQASSGTQLTRSPQAPADPQEQTSTLSDDGSSEQVASKPESEDSEQSGVDDVLPDEIPVAYGGSGNSDESDSLPEPESGPIAMDNTGSTIYWQEVVNHTSKQHDLAPNPRVPRRYCGVYRGEPIQPGIKRHERNSKCNKRAKKTDNSGDLAGYTKLNAWDSVIINPRQANNIGQSLELGPMKMAVLKKNGRWETITHKPPCKGRLYKPTKFSANIGGQSFGNPVISCNGNASLGLGSGKWTSSDLQHHGWTGQQWRMNTSDIQGVALYMPAKLTGSNLNNNQQYLVQIGIDLKGGKASGKTRRFTPALASRYRFLFPGGKPTALFGSSFSPQKWLQLCESGNLPDGFPFEKNCNVPQS